ncbi:PIF1 helicase-like protein [Trypanosoma theileri]|uniref:PIF1 helicase-like protein n=1 Tax=Trypanosoma theileri TaxID=67003 RepID=A0A1X0NYN6_9TRYP|nr:PIF1 helicase-like protein [Trypanosoma theileri]ORC89668.1 PIF1 helicase-like protein [Trypanosoma theileri]
MPPAKVFGALFGIPLVSGIGWTMYSSRNVRSVMHADPLLVSSYCRQAAAKTREEGIPSLMCAFEVPVILPTANVREALSSYSIDGSLYALHALLSSFFMRVEVITTAFSSRWRPSDAYRCWKSTSRRALAEERQSVLLGHHDKTERVYGEWELSFQQQQQQKEEKEEKEHNSEAEAILKYEDEAISVSLVPTTEGSRQAMLRLCYIVQPFDCFERDSTTEKVVLWCLEKYGMLLTAQAARALEFLEK